MVGVGVADAGSSAALSLIVLLLVDSLILESDDLGSNKLGGLLRDLALVHSTSY